MYSIICWHAYDKDYCWPSYANLAKRMGCSVNSIKNYFRELVKANLVLVKKESYRSSKYILLKPSDEMLNDGKQEYYSENYACPQDANLSNFDDNLSKFGENPSNIGYLKNPIKQTKEPPLPINSENSDNRQNENSHGVGDSFSDFESIWEAYPRKEAKGLAKAAWRNLLRSGSLPAIATILETIERFKASANWQRENGRFIPQLSNFLKGERWNDPLPEAEIAEQQQKQRVENIKKRHLEQEELAKQEHEAKTRQLEPLFEEFAAKFTGKYHRPYVFGHWLALHDKGNAPLASDVPSDNELDIAQFLKRFSQNRNYEQSKTSSGNGGIATRPETISPQKSVNSLERTGSVASSGVLMRQLLSKLRLGIELKPDGENENSAKAFMVA